MRPIPTTVLSIALWLVCLFAIDPSATAARNCGWITFRTQVEVPAGGFSLSDLLSPGTCAEVLAPAGRVILGAAPLVGSVRILTGADLRVMLEKLEQEGRGGPRASIVVPERIMIRRAAYRDSCVDLATRLELAGADGGHSRPISSEGVECGAADRIPQTATLQIGRREWNRALRTWDVSVECISSSDCVPFLMRLRNNSLPHTGSVLGPSLSDQGEDPAGAGQRFSTGIGSGNAVKPVPLVRRGEKVTLAWDEAGIRIVLPAISLDSGALGDRVRARLEPSGRLMYAVIVDRGRLQAGS